MVFGVVNGQVVTSGKKSGQVGYDAYLKTGSEVCFCAQVGFEDRVLQLRQKGTGYFYQVFSMKQKIYIETSIPSFYHDDRVDAEIVARRKWTREWWDNHRDKW